MQNNTNIRFAKEAMDTLTNVELSPSTRDLLTLEGIAADVQWADAPGEQLELIDVILSEYEAEAVRENNYEALRQIVNLRVDLGHVLASINKAQS